jgi:hypothetical protein
MEWNYEGHWHRCPNSSEDNIPVVRLTAPTEGSRMSVVSTNKNEFRRDNNLKHTDLGPNPFWGFGTLMFHWGTSLTSNPHVLSQRL